MPRTVHAKTIEDCVAGLCGKASCELPDDVLSALESAFAAEGSPQAKGILRQCLDNARMARSERIPICQDTGTAVLFIEMGQEVLVEGGTLKEAIDNGIARGYKDAFLRKSIVSDPIFDRRNTKDNTPSVIHLEQVPGDSLKITLCPKGGGAENMGALAMLKPSQGMEGVADFVVKTVVGAGGNPCPPVIVGVGVGGNFETAPLLAKKALLRELGAPSPDSRYAKLERDVLERINASGVGAQGLGGDITALAVHIEFMPCHIASLPVAVNLNCHAARHLAAEI